MCIIYIYIYIYIHTEFIRDARDYVYYSKNLNSF